MYPAAYKVKVEDLIFGKYESSEESGSSLLTPWGVRVKKVRILGTVVGKYMKPDGTYAALSVDDGSGVIRVKAWREDVEMFKNIQEGDTVDIMGRVRERDGEVYLTPNLIKKVEDPNLELLRELEILEERLRMLRMGVKPGAEPNHPKERILELIRGANRRMSAEEISKLVGIPTEEAERLLRELLAEGRIVESEVGKFEVA